MSANTIYSVFVTPSWHRRLRHNTVLTLSSPTRRSSDLESRYSEKLISSNGYIWFCHIKNGCRKVVYDGEKFTSFSFTKEGNNLSDSNVHNIVEGSNGRIWVATAKGLNLINQDNSQYLLKNGNFWEMTTFEDEEFFISFYNEILYYDENSDQIKIRATIPYNNFRITSTINENGIWNIFTNIGIIRYDFKNNVFLELPDKEILDGVKVKDNLGNWWIYNKSGNLWRFENNKVKSKFKLIPDDKLGFIDNERFSIVEDEREIGRAHV